MYAFDSDLTLEQMQAKLNASGPWSWDIGDSYWYGDYLRTHPNQDQGRVGIMEQRQSPVFVGGPDDPKYLLWVSNWGAGSKSALAYAKLVQIIREQILPAIGARSIEPAEGF